MFEVIGVLLSYSIFYYSFFEFTKNYKRKKQISNIHYVITCFGILLLFLAIAYFSNHVKLVGFAVPAIVGACVGLSKPAPPEEEEEEKEEVSK